MNRQKGPQPTPSTRRVVSLLVRGYTHREAALELGLAPDTIKGMLTNWYSTEGASNLIHALFKNGNVHLWWEEGDTDGNQ